MSTIKEIRGVIDAKLDKWEAEATALQAQLELNKEEVIERVEEQKRRFEQVAQHIKDKISEASGLADDVKAKIITAFEHLQVQLTLGAADTRDAYQDWKQKIQSSIAAFEAELDVAIAKEDTALKADLDALMDAYIREEDALEVEIDAMQAQFDEEKARAKNDYEKFKQDVQSKIAAFKVELDDKRKTATGELENFETELTAGANKIKDAFNNLFS